MSDTQERDREVLMRFIDAVSPFVRDVLDEPWPFRKNGYGQLITRMTHAEYIQAVDALEALRD